MGQYTSMLNHYIELILINYIIFRNQVASQMRMIQNPYAKKSSSTLSGSSLKNPSASSTNNKQATNKKNSSIGNASSMSKADIVLGSAGSFMPATFSQAFESIGESNIYQREMAEYQKSNGARDKEVVVEGNSFMKTADIGGTSSNEAMQVVDGQQNQCSVEERRFNHAYLKAHVLHVSLKQRGNPVLKFIRNVPYEFSDIVPDYILGVNRCALFLSLKYHT